MGNTCICETRDSSALANFGEEAFDETSEHASYVRVSSCDLGDLPHLIGAQQTWQDNPRKIVSASSQYLGKPSSRERLPAITEVSMGTPSVASSRAEPADLIPDKIVGSLSEQSNGEMLKPTVRLIFECNGDERPVVLRRRPLGVDFNKSIGGPTVIRSVHPHSYAAELGLEPGWIIKFVDTEDVSKKTIQHIQTSVKNALMTLPEVEQ
jgi:hypothetical protein